MRYLLCGLAVLLAGGICKAARMDPPAWAAEAVWYQIFPERFCSGDSNNDPTRDSLELPVSPEPSWRISRWTTDWYSRKHEADARAMWLWRGRNGVCRALGVGNAPTRKPQTCENTTEDPETGPDRPW